jgi:hypothetical protein
MQTMVRGQPIQIDPQLISVVIGVPVLLVFGVPFPNEAPSIDFLHDFFGTRPQREDKSHSQVNISAFAHAPIFSKGCCDKPLSSSSSE